MDAIDLLRKRYSARALKAPAPQGEALEIILESAVRAPDHGNLQPWRFVLIETAQREAFGAVLAAHLQRTRSNVTAQMMEGESRKAFRAPLIIVVAASCNPAVKVPAIEQVLSAGAAAQNMMLAAFAQDFNGMWKTGGPAYDDEVKRSLGLKATDAIVGFLYLGTEDGEPPTPERPSWREFTRTWKGLTG